MVDLDLGQDQQRILCFRQEQDQQLISLFFNRRKIEEKQEQ